MWRLFNWLFGWDYIYFDYGYYGYGVRRVRKLPNGAAWYQRNFRIRKIAREDEVIWLTCKSSKYLDDQS